MTQAADVGRGAADVDDDRVAEAREKRGAAHAVGGPGGEAVDGERLGRGGQHHGAVVLGEIERRGQAAGGQRLGEGAGRAPGEADQRGVEQRRVLALQQADAAELVRERHRGVGTLFAEDRRGVRLALGVERREHRGDRHRGDPGRPDPARGIAHASLVERHDGPAVVFVAALEHDDLAAHEGCEVVGPVDEGRQRRAGRQADPDRGHAGEVAPLDDGVREVRGADHDGIDRTARPHRGQELAKRRRDAAGDVGGRRGLDGMDDGVAVEQNRVGIGAADVEADAPHEGKRLTRGASLTRTPT